MLMQFPVPVGTHIAVLVGHREGGRKWPAVVKSFTGEHPQWRMEVIAAIQIEATQPPEFRAMVLYASSDVWHVPEAWATNDVYQRLWWHLERRLHPVQCPVTVTTNDGEVRSCMVDHTWDHRPHQA